MELIESHKEKLSWGLFLLLVVGIIGRISFPEHLYPGDPYWVRVQAQAWLDGRGDVPLPYAVHPPMEKGQFFFCCPRNNQYHIKYGVLITAFTAPPIYVWNKLSGRSIWDMADWYQNFIRENPSWAMGYNVCQWDRSLVSVLNYYNLLWSLFLAATLYASALLFCKRPALGVAWTLITLFAGYGWNYLRAQTCEIFQWAMASLFFFCAAWMLRYVKQERKIPTLLWLGTWLGVGSLVLMKSSYILLIPIWLAVTFWPARKSGSELPALDQEINTNQPDSFATSLKEFVKRCLNPWVWLPTSLIVAVFLGCNYWRFGGIFCTGYTQWAEEANPLSNNPWVALYGFLFRQDKSIFIHQPLLIFSLFALPSFFKRFPRTAWLISLSFLVNLLLISKYVNWSGGGCYGPRYLIFILSQLTWPALLLFDYLADHQAELKHKLCSLLIISVVGISFYFQVIINSLDFYTYYQVDGFLTWLKVSENVSSKFKERYWGLLCREFRLLRDKGVQPQWLIELSKENPNAARYINAKYKYKILDN